MTSTTVLRYMEAADRTITLSHAIRHLLFHVDPIWSPQYQGDTDAIFIMQNCMDGPEAFVPPAKCNYEMGESTYGAGDSLPCGREADESGLCAKHRGEMGI